MTTYCKRWCSYFEYSDTNRDQRPLHFFFLRKQNRCTERVKIVIEEPFTSMFCQTIMKWNMRRMGGTGKTNHYFIWIQNFKFNPSPINFQSRIYLFFKLQTYHFKRFTFSRPDGMSPGHFSHHASLSVKGWWFGWIPELTVLSSAVSRDAAFVSELRDK